MISVAVKISLIFLFLSLLSLIFIILYLTFWRPTLQNPICLSTPDCPSGSSCINGYCSEIQCQNNNDCHDLLKQPAICMNSYCYSYACINSNDCSSDSACINGQCLTIGNSCSRNSDCGSMICHNGSCVQCTQNDDCESGSICINNICKYGDISNITPGNQILYLSNANFNGNISAPSGYYCGVDICGQPDQPQTPHNCGCTSDPECPTTCPYCINSVCRCIQGELYESCNQNNDCISGLCADTEKGRICVQKGGECAFNYNEKGGQGTCTNPHLPYCVDGICSATSNGAFCGASSDPPDLCSNPSKLINSKTLIPPTTPDGMGFFCVNGRCQSEPGTLNNLCSANSCQYINSQGFDCHNGRCNVKSY